MTELQNLAAILERRNQGKSTALRLSAPAPTGDDEADTADEAEQKGRADAAFARLKELLEAWAWWCNTRRYFAPLRRSGITLGNLARSRRPFDRAAGGPDAGCSSQMVALNTAIHGCASRGALHGEVFVVHFCERPDNIKAAAARIGISRRHYYRLLEAFCLEVLAAAAAIEASNLQAGAALPHAPERMAA